jgi:transcriptional regulator with XRE-family HTH domain
MMVEEQPLTLRDVAMRAVDLHDGKRGRALGREAERLGLVLSYTTLDKILAGTYKSRPTPETLKALAKLARMPEAEVYAAANEPLPLAPFANELPADVDQLPPAARRVVLGLIRYLLDMERTRPSAPSPMAPTGRGRVAKAVRDTATGARVVRTQEAQPIGPQRRRH